jgi:hypothetical protein
MSNAFPNPGTAETLLVCAFDILIAANDINRTNTLFDNDFAYIMLVVAAEVGDLTLLKP